MPSDTIQPPRWDSVKSGDRHEFVCLQIDIAGHSKLKDSERILHEAKGQFHNQITNLVQTHGGKLLKWEGDGGAFLFLSADSQAFVESVHAAFDVLEALPRLNEELKAVSQLSQSLSLRISLDTGVAVYDTNPGLITSDFLNAFLKNERAVSLVDAVTITERVYRQISVALRERFTLYKESKEVGCKVYSSSKASPSPAQAAAPIDRAALVQCLNGLSSSQLSAVLSRFEGVDRHISRRGTAAENVQELLSFIESTGGPGLPVLASVLENFVRARPGS